jgi:hypothetical protein
LNTLVSDPAFSGVLEKRQFQFFRLNTVPGTNYFIDSRFWDRILLQACHRTDAVKHAVLALSFWHQSFDLSALNGSDPCRSRHYADVNYHIGLEHAQTLLNTSSGDDVDLVLIACVVFALYEAVRGDHLASQEHVNNGRAIIAQYSGKISAPMIEMFTRMDLSFWDQTPPNPHGTLEDMLDRNTSLATWEFQKLSEAKTALFDLAHWLMIARIDHLDDAVDEEIYMKCVAERVKCLNVLQTWKERFDSFVQQTDLASSELIVLHLEMMFNMGYILTQADPRASETQYDAFHPHFEAVISCGERIVERLVEEPPQQAGFSYEAGYVMILFSAVVRCREPQLRRRAVQVLRTLSRREGLWDSKSAAAIAERVIWYEEDKLGEVNSAADVPESNRLLLMDIELGPEAAVATVMRCNSEFGSCSFRIGDNK